ncbi:MAG TPA: hypothetical protein VEY95_01685 [Azospirillaceae bacterium]|nr:hypothetical protein [Azospirillaceae bacterium]
MPAHGGLARTLGLLRLTPSPVSLYRFGLDGLDRARAERIIDEAFGEIGVVDWLTNHQVAILVIEQRGTSGVRKPWEAPAGIQSYQQARATVIRLLREAGCPGVPRRVELTALRRAAGEIEEPDDVLLHLARALPEIVVRDDC